MRCSARFAAPRTKQDGATAANAGLRSAAYGSPSAAAPGGALSRYKKGGGTLSAGAVVLVVCVLIAVLNFFLSSEPRNYGTLINPLVGLVVALPMIIIGMARVSRAGALLKDDGAANGQIRGRAAEPTSLPPDARTVALPAERSPAGGNVTGQTTLKLRRG